MVSKLVATHLGNALLLFLYLANQRDSSSFGSNPYSIFTKIFAVSFQDLNMNFRSIILPETLKLIQSQDASILSLLSMLESCVRESTLPLDTLVAQLEVCHRNVLMGLEVRARKRGRGG